MHVLPRLPSSLSLASGLPEGLALRAAVTRLAIEGRALRPSLAWLDVLDACGLDADLARDCPEEVREIRRALRDLGYRPGMGRGPGPGRVWHLETVAVQVQ